MTTPMSKDNFKMTRNNFPLFLSGFFQNEETKVSDGTKLSFKTFI